ncbi:MAG: hypothetical protein AAFO07_25505 [Bacteroidota bacterium]
MGFFDRFFRSEPINQPNISFGRYTDSYKTTEKFEYWDRSVACFQDEDYLCSYEAFFEYLKDEDENNVKYWRDGECVRFELYQGSKKITGYANVEKIRAEAKIAHTESSNIGFMRRLLEKNFELKFSRFAFDEDDNIVIVFDTYSIDGSPYKLYNALKELATNADKQDDLLLDEFNMLKPVDTSHLEEIPEVEKEVKYDFIQNELGKVFKHIKSLDRFETDYPHGISILLLELIYRIDYLTKPEGYTMELLERMHRMYFSKDNKSLLQKNQMLKNGFSELFERPQIEYYKEMYRVTSTFGITSPIGHDRVVDFIDAEMSSINWYSSNAFEKVAAAIPSYIIGSSLFNFSVPKPIRDLFFLYYQITNHDYFKKLGFEINYVDPKTRGFNSKTIKKGIEQIVQRNKKLYPELNPATNLLKYNNNLEFGKSFLMLVRNLQIIPKEF